jgi:hypothetical protein
MLSLLGKSILTVLVLLLVALITVLLVDERSGHTATSLCKLRDGSTVVVRTIYNSVFARLLRALTHQKLYAITVWNRIYVTSDYLVPSGLRHEHEHVRQWHELGAIRFIVTYLWDLITAGYEHHPLEHAARVAAGQLPYRR